MMWEICEFCGILLDNCLNCDYSNFHEIMSN